MSTWLMALSVGSWCAAPDHARVQVNVVLGPLAVMAGPAMVNSLNAGGLAATSDVLATTMTDETMSAATTPRSARANQGGLLDVSSGTGVLLHDV